MTPSNLEEQLVKYLTDAHSIEVQALAQMRSAPDIAGGPELAAAFAAHLTETEEHERLVHERLLALGADPSRIKDAAGAVTGKGFVLFARAQPDTPGKLIAHAYSYEHMELAAYDLLARLAGQVGDSQTAEMARRIEAQEQAMARRLEALFARAAQASLDEVGRDDLGEQLAKYLADAHAIEEQALAMLDKAPELAGAPELASAYSEHRAETVEHQRLVARELESLDASPSRLKDAAMHLGALNWGGFFAAQPDTPAKLAAFAYAFEHLEIAGYELLRAVARQAGNSSVATTADHILGQERAAAQRLRSLFDEALEASLREQGLVAS